MFETAISEFQQWLDQTPLLGHPWVQFLVIVILSSLLAHALNAFLRRSGLCLQKRTNNRLDDAVFEIIRGPIFWLVTFVGLRIGLLQFQFSEQITSRINSAIASAIIVILAYAAYRLLRLVLQTLANYARKGSLLRPETLPLFQNISLLLIFIGSTYLLFSAWRIDMTAWLASAGIAGVAIGFAAKDTLANLFSGVFIMADAPYRVGDTVVLETGERGEITHIGLRSTRMFTTDHAEITIPNSIMGNTKVINQSGGYHRKARIRAPIGVAYGSDIDQVRSVLTKIAQTCPDVCALPEPRVRFRQFGASSLDFELLFWIDNAQIKGRVLDEVNASIYNTFNEQGIEIPYSTQDVHIRSMPPREG